MSIEQFIKSCPKEMNWESGNYDPEVKYKSHFFIFELYKFHINTVYIQTLWTYTILTFKKVWSKLNFSEVRLEYHMINYIYIYICEVVWLKSKFQHTGTWSASTWPSSYTQQYSSATFLSWCFYLHKEKLAWLLKMCFSTFTLYFFELHKSEIV